jgi:hypothetical protein
MLSTTPAPVSLIRLALCTAAYDLALLGPCLDRRTAAGSGREGQAGPETPAANTRPNGLGQPREFLKP